MTSALSAIYAFVLLLISVSASVPPAATAPLAEASAVVSAVTLFFAEISSAPPASTVLSPPIPALALLLITLIATPASPGSLTISGNPATALLLTVDIAPIRVSPLEMIFEVPPTLTPASELATTVATGEMLGIVTLTADVAVNVTFPPVASIVLESMAISALAAGTVIGSSVLSALLLALTMTFAPLSIALLTLTEASPPDVLEASSLSSLSATISIRPPRITTLLAIARPFEFTTSVKSGAVPTKLAPLKTDPATLIAPALRFTPSIALI